MMTQDTPYVYLNKDYENDASNIEAKPETDKRPRRGFLRLSSVLPTSRVFTSGYVNTETILHFFNINHRINQMIEFFISASFPASKLRLNVFFK